MLLNMALAQSHQLARPSRADEEVHVIIECTCGRKFKHPTTYQLITAENVLHLQGRVFAHARDRHDEQMRWSEVTELDVECWRSDWAKQYKMPIRIAPASRSRSPPQVHRMRMASSKSMPRPLGSSWAGPRIANPFQPVEHDPPLSKSDAIQLHAKLDTVIESMSIIMGKFEQWDEWFNEK